jgi:DNA-binding MarR family transcriptional regulator
VSSGNDGHEYLTDVEFRAWHGSLQFTNEAMRAIDEALAAAHGLSIKEFDVLITLYNAPDTRLRMTELSESVVLSPSGMTHLVTRLERDGLVSRSADANDRRSFLVTLTKKGHRRLEEARPTHNEVVRARLTRRLSRTELAEMGKLWDKVLGSQ